MMIMTVTQYIPTGHIPTRGESVIMMKCGNMTQSNSRQTRQMESPKTRFRQPIDTPKTPIDNPQLPLSTAKNGSSIMTNLKT